jgi:hypothetical protein
LKISNLFIEFPFIWLNCLKFVEPRKAHILIENIHSAALFATLPPDVAPLVPHKFHLCK